MKKRNFTIALLIAAAMIVGLHPAHASANGGDDEVRPFKLYATARLGPIGRVIASSYTATAVVDGRAASGEMTLWGGELVQAPRDRSVRVSFDAVGEAVLSRGALARFSTSVSSTDDGRNVLVTRLIAGRLSVRLSNDAGAYVETEGTGFMASNGASFNVSLNEEGRPVIEAERGVVTAEAQTAPQGRYTLRPPSGQGGSLSIAARSTRQIQIQVTDENDKPVPDLPILFSLADPCLGSLGAAAAGTVFSGKTDNQGVATVTWVAGLVRCSGSIVARVEGTNFAYTFQATIRPVGFWTFQNTALVGAAAAAAGAGTTVYVVTRNNDPEPIRPVPPTQVRP